MAINLQYDVAGTPVLADGALAAFNPAFSKTIGDEDAAKMTSSSEGIAIKNNNELFIIDARPMPQDKDTLFLSVDRLTKPQYTLQIFTKQLGAITAQPYIEDAYLNTSTPLSVTDTNRIVFIISSANPASSAANRFRIVFKQMDVLPVAFTSIQAAVKNNEIQVDWNVAQQYGVSKYEVERSANGADFTKMAVVSAKSNSMDTYQWIDASPVYGTNYYRVRAIHQDGKTNLTRIVTAKIEANTGGGQLVVFPNPVKDQQIKFQLKAIDEGQYTFLLYNSQGQVILKQLFDHKSGASNHLIQLNRKLPGGMYYLYITNKTGHYRQPVLIE